MPRCCGVPGDGDGHGELTFDGAGSDPDLDPALWSSVNDPMFLGLLFYHNEPIYSGSGLDSIDLDVEVTVTDPSNMGLGTFGFGMTIDETANPNGDTVLILGPSPRDQSFYYGGCEYEFEMLGFQIDSEGEVLSELFLPENGSTTVGLYGRITGGPCTVPDGGATMTLLGSALVVLAMLRRK